MPEPTPKLVALFVRVPGELRDQLKAEADTAGISMSKHVGNLLTAAVQPDVGTEPGEGHTP